ncbi:MAG: T9SS type A sorting domain-containing protein [Flavobacterium sp.]|nr:T9SS type A sorting domain-containing protein [Flavobacterium sp.]
MCGRNGTSASVASGINNITNWNNNDSTAYNPVNPGCTFMITCPPLCTNPTVPTITASVNPVCQGNTTTLNIAGTLNSATQWAIYRGSCGGTLVGTTTTSTFVVTPTGPSTTYYVRGEGGCVTPGSCGTLTVNVSSVSIPNTAQSNVTCNGAANGAASVVPATGGVGPYTYNWTPGNPTGDGTTSVTGLTAGTWTCTVTDANSCTTAVNFTITQPTALALTPASQTNIACNGGSNGAAAVNVATGGAGGYTYNWTPGNPTGDGTTSVTGLTAGTWTCTVTDANGCTTAVNFTITQPTALVATAIVDNNASCNGLADGGATASATGGTSPYTYAWSNGATTASITGIVAGTYNVTITDGNGCTDMASVTITQPSAIDNTISENSTGILTANASDSGMTYQWYECPNTLLTGETNQNFTPTSLGDYKVSISFNGCTVESDCYTVTALGTNTFDSNVTFSMYPNPTSGILTIKTSIDGDFIIANQLGQTVKSFKVNGGIENSINIENLSDGIYFVKGTNGTQISSQRLIIKK